MASASDGYSPNNGLPAESRFANEFVARLADGELLERIIQETMLGAGDESAEDLRPLRQVAARFPSTAFSLAPVAVEMVRAAIGPSYRGLVGSDDAWQAMTQGIAQTLFDDPRSRQRLEVLWRRLQEAER